VESTGNCLNPIDSWPRSLSSSGCARSSSVISQLFKGKSGAELLGYKFIFMNGIDRVKLMSRTLTFHSEMQIFVLPNKVHFFGKAASMGCRRRCCQLDSHNILPRRGSYRSARKRSPLEKPWEWTPWPSLCAETTFPEYFAAFQVRPRRKLQNLILQNKTGNFILKV